MRANCAVLLLGRSWRRATASRQVSRLQVDGNCSKTKNLFDETKLKAGLDTSLELLCRETMEIRNKTSGQASRQASGISNLGNRSKTM